MEQVIRYILLFVAIGILLAIIFNYQARKKRCRLKEQLQNIKQNYEHDFLQNPIETAHVSNIASQILNPDPVKFSPKKESVVDECICAHGNDSFVDDDIYAQNFHEYMKDFDCDYNDNEFTNNNFTINSAISNFSQNHINLTQDNHHIFEDIQFISSKNNKEHNIVITGNKKFGGYSLLQTILAHDLHYGEDKLFHKILQNNFAEKIFSLRPENSIGYFDLSNMQSFECDKLILELNDFYNHIDNYTLMQQTAEDLADDLGAMISK